VLKTGIRLKLGLVLGNKEEDDTKIRMLRCIFPFKFSVFLKETERKLIS